MSHCYLFQAIYTQSFQLFLIIFPSRLLSILIVLLQTHSSSPMFFLKCSALDADCREEKLLILPDIIFLLKQCRTALLFQKLHHIGFCICSCWNSTSDYQDPYESYHCLRKLLIFYPCVISKFDNFNPSHIQYIEQNGALKQSRTETFHTFSFSLSYWHILTGCNCLIRSSDL